MSLYIDTNKLPIFEIIKRLYKLINTQYVINHISIRRYYLKEENFTLEDNKEINKEAVGLKAQFQKLFNSNTYQITYFDSYGRKSGCETFENKRDFKKAFYRYANGNLIPFRFNKFGKIKTREKHKDLIETYGEYFDESKVLSYHKQRISKKLTCNTFVSNELDIKIEVYKWLIKKNKNAVIIPEYSIGNRRADYISFDTNKINVTIVEIKSELDTFDRLEAQIQQYSLIANSVYLAIDEKQFKKLNLKNITIPHHIGILIYDNKKAIKLKEFTKAKKNPFTLDYPFIDSLSYNNINNAFTGFKYSTKFTKERKEEIMKEFIKKQIINKFAYDILCNRYIIESNKRKDLYNNSQIELCAASSKELKINRFDVTGKYTITLSSYFNNKEFLKDLFIKKQNEFIDIFGSIKYYKQLSNMENIRKIRNDLNLPYSGHNEYDNYNFLIKNATLIKDCFNI